MSPDDDAKPEFVPKNFARKTCGTCRGEGIIRYAFYAGKYENVVKPCGCATKRYLKAVRDLRDVPLGGSF